MSEPSERITERTNPLDGVFIGLGTMLLMVLIAPLMWLAAVRFVPQDTRGLAAAYQSGALAMCRHFADEAGVPWAQAESICEELATELSNR